MKTTVKGVVAAAIAAAGLATAAPALAETEPIVETVAVVNCITPEAAVASAVGASPLDLSKVGSVDWCYDGDGHDFVVTLTSTSGDVWTLRVDTVTGAAHLTS